MPGAIWRPLPASTVRISSYDILCWHTMVGSLDGTDAYFRKIAPGVNSHFGVGHDGTIYQWVDTAFRSGANLNGNYHIVSVETADFGPGFPAWNTNDGSAVPAWTPAQIQANARIAAWANQEHGIPIELIPDARPERRGNGYHRQGVPGYMVPGAEKWSNATGKVCPGNRRIVQIPAVLDRSRQIVNGDEDMSYSQWPKEDRDRLLVEIREFAIRPMLGDTARSVWSFNTSGQGVQAQDRLTGIDWLVQAIARKDVSAGEIADALAPRVVAALPTQSVNSGGLTVEDIQAAMRQVLVDEAHVF